MMNRETPKQLRETISLLSYCPPNPLQLRAEQLLADPLIAGVIYSKAFRRLRGISFLGALDYVGPTHKLTKRFRSRADHSLHVAALAGYVAQKRGYSEDLERHLVIAGLLHDIGHPPLSHSIEPYLEKTFGFGHHEMGEMLLSAKTPEGRRLAKALRGINISFVSDLIAGKAADADGGDLFSSPINIDTIEGIIRSYRYLKNSATGLSPLEVADASFLADGEERYKVLDAFWELKGFVYDRLITRDIGLIADQYSQAYLAQTKHPLLEAELFHTEAKWRRKHDRLFERLAKIRSKTDTPVELDNSVVEYKKRSYTILRDQFGLQRYRSTKHTARVTLSAAFGQADEKYGQLSLIQE